MTEVRDWMGQGENWEGGWCGLGLGEGSQRGGSLGDHRLGEDGAEASLDGNQHVADGLCFLFYSIVKQIIDSSKKLFSVT